MLTKRVIPCMDVTNGRVVKGINFVDLRDAGNPVELAKVYDREGADEVIFLDITATSDDRATTIGLASRAAAELRIPYTVGGGFRDIAGARTMIAAGADKISMCSAALRDPELITLASRAFGSQAVIVAIDAKRVGDGDKWEAYVAGGRIPTGVDAIAWAEEAARRGAGEILLTSMDRDGTQDGFDIPLTRTVARAVPIPVIASGGVGKLEHFAEASSTARPTRCSRRACSISAPSASARSKSTWPARASPCVSISRRSDGAYLGGGGAPLQRPGPHPRDRPAGGYRGGAHDDVDEC